MISNLESTQLEKSLFELEKRIKKVATSTEARSTLISFGSLEQTLPATNTILNAKFCFLKGVLLSKIARRNMLTNLCSSTEQAQESLRLLIEASTLVQALLNEEMSSSLSSLGQRCVYEAAAVSTLLIKWGVEPDIIIGTPGLGPETIAEITRAIKKRRILPSRF